MRQELILLIDSDGHSRKQYKPSLIEAGYQVQAVVTTETPTVVIAAMPLSAEEKEQCARLQQRHPKPFLLCFVPAAQPQQAAEALTLGADDLLKRPFGTQELLGRIKLLTDRRQRANIGSSSENVTGDISEFSVRALIEQFQQGKGTAKATLQHEKDQGKLFFRKGRLHAVLMNHLQGFDALLRLLQWNEGQFQISPLSEDEMPHLGALEEDNPLRTALEALRRWEEELAHLPDRHATLEIDRQLVQENLSQLNELSHQLLWQLTSQRSLQGVLETFEGNTIEVLRELRRLYTLKFFKVAPKKSMPTIPEPNMMTGEEKLFGDLNARPLGGQLTSSDFDDFADLLSSAAQDAARYLVAAARPQESNSLFASESDLQSFDLDSYSSSASYTILPSTEHSTQTDLPASSASLDDSLTAVEVSDQALTTRESLLSATPTKTSIQTVVASEPTTDDLKSFDRTVDIDNFLSQEDIESTDVAINDVQVDDLLSELSDSMLTYEELQSAPAAAEEREAFRSLDAIAQAQQEQPLARDGDQNTLDLGSQKEASQSSLQTVAPDVLSSDTLGYGKTEEPVLLTPEPKQEEPEADLVLSQDDLVEPATAPIPRLSPAEEEARRKHFASSPSSLDLSDVLESHTEATMNLLEQEFSETTSSLAGIPRVKTEKEQPALTIPETQAVPSEEFPSKAAKPEPEVFVTSSANLDAVEENPGDSPILLNENESSFFREDSSATVKVEADDSLSDLQTAAPAPNSASAASFPLDDDEIVSPPRDPNSISSEFFVDELNYQSSSTNDTASGERGKTFLWLFLGLLLAGLTFGVLYIVDPLNTNSTNNGGLGQQAPSDAGERRLPPTKRLAQTPPDDANATAVKLALGTTDAGTSGAALLKPTSDAGSPAPRTDAGADSAITNNTADAGTPTPTPTKAGIAQQRPVAPPALRPTDRPLVRRPVPQPRIVRRTPPRRRVRVAVAPRRRVAVRRRPAPRRRVRVASSDRKFRSLMRSAARAKRRERFRSAERSYRQALKLKPNSLDAMVGLGNVLYERSKMRTALRYLERAYRTSPRRMGTGLVTLGSIYYEQNKVSKAKRVYKQYLRYNPRGRSARDVKSMLRSMPGG